MLIHCGSPEHILCMLLCLMCLPFVFRQSDPSINPAIHNFFCSHLFFFIKVYFPGSKQSLIVCDLLSNGV